MKRKLVSVATLVLVGCVVMLSCGKKVNANASEMPADSIDTVEVEDEAMRAIAVELDSVVVQKKWPFVITCEEDRELFSDYEEGNLYECVAEFPKVDKYPELTRSLMVWLNEKCLGNEYKGSNYLNVKEVVTCRLQKKGNVEDNFQYSAELRKIFENEKVITFLWTDYYFGYGVHGTSTCAGVTLRKSDGKVLGLNMFKGVGALRGRLVKGLKQYFEVSTDADLLDNLQMEESKLSKLPMPEVEPWLTDEGIVFLYQQYEIACYAAGMPCVTIPVSQLHSILTPEARALLEP